MKNRLLAIGGATGSGKTELAVMLAKAHSKLVLLSADSRQVYKYLNVGSAKVGKSALDYRLTGKAEPVRVANNKSQYLVDLAEPNTDFTLADYQKEAYRLIRSCWEQNKIPLLVGGTGLYIQAITEGYVIEGKVNAKLRAELEQLSLEELQQKLAKLDLEVVETDRANKRRLIRALERAQGGISAQGVKREPITDDVHTFVLERPWEEQRDLAPIMVKERLALGLVEESKMLLQNKVKKDWLYSMGLSYRLVIDMFDGKFPEWELEDRMINAFRQLMRRQRTWFNRMPHAQKMTSEEIFHAISELIKS